MNKMNVGIMVSTDKGSYYHTDIICEGTLAMLSSIIVLTVHGVDFPMIHVLNESTIYRPQLSSLTLELKLANTKLNELFLKSVVLDEKWSKA